MDALDRHLAAMGLPTGDMVLNLQMAIVDLLAKLAAERPLDADEIALGESTMSVLTAQLTAARANAAVEAATADLSPEQRAEAERRLVVMVEMQKPGGGGMRH